MVKEALFHRRARMRYRPHLFPRIPGQDKVPGQLRDPAARGEISLPENRCETMIRQARRVALAAFFLVLVQTAQPAFAQYSRQTRFYSRLNSFGVLAAYSGDSSHMLLGSAERRKLLLIGISYSRRLTLSRAVGWQYSAELFPVALEGDPLSVFVNEQSAPVKDSFVTPGDPPDTCSPMTVNYIFPGQNGETYAGTATTYCHGRRWTMGQAMSPIGFQWNFLPTRKLQPLITGHGGYMYSTREIPMAGAGAFNFTFGLGAGFELYTSPTRSVRLEYRYHHISNDHTADINPGIDNGLFQMTYSFGH
jgi:hypothetical protein